MKTKQTVTFQLASLIIRVLWFKSRSDFKHKILNYLFCQHCAIKHLVALEFLKYENMFCSIKWRSHLLWCWQKRRWSTWKEHLAIDSEKCCGNHGMNQEIVYMKNWWECFLLSCSCYLFLCLAHTKRRDPFIPEESSPNPELFWINLLF